MGLGVRNGRIAVLGGAGQLGRDLTGLLTDAVSITRAEADLTRTETVRRTLTEMRPRLVINCAAYNFVDRAEDEPEAAFAVNAWGVRGLARVCRDLDCPLVQFSTDYVFGLDENNTQPLDETAAPGPASVYGLSKLAGEYLVRATLEKHFIIRTCGLYGLWGSGGKGGNFVETMLRLAKEGKTIRVVADQTCTPTYTKDLAEILPRVIESGRFGTYHASNAGQCSWYEFARSIFELSKVQATVVPITTQEFGAKARRPKFSVLANRAISDLGLKPMRNWKEALEGYLAERSSRHK